MYLLLLLQGKEDEVGIEAAAGLTASEVVEAAEAASPPPPPICTVRVLGVYAPPPPPDGVVRRRSTLGEAGYDEPWPAGRDCCCFSGESGDGVDEAFVGCGPLLPSSELKLREAIR